MADEQRTKWNEGWCAWWGVVSWGTLTALWIWQGYISPWYCVAPVLFGMSIGRVTWSKA